jgi:hypothetical protein
VQAIDEGATLTCVVTVASAAGASSPVLSASMSVPAPVVAGCPAATGRAAGTALGRVRLGMTRRQVRHAYARSADRASRYEDVFCLTPVGVHAGYASPKLLQSVPRARRATLQGRLVWIATGSAFYAIDGARVGATLTAARTRLKLGKVLAVGRARWYLAPAGGAMVALKVQGGVVQEIGLAARQLTASRVAQLALLSSF